MQLISLGIQNQNEAKKAMLSLGATKRGSQIMASKAAFRTFKVEGIKSWEANILKQHLLSLGSDAAIERDALVKEIKTGAIIFGSFNQLSRLALKLKNQTKRLNLLSKQLSQALAGSEKDSYNYKARDKILRIKKPVLCGIINVTKDSFSGDGLLKKTDLTSPHLEKVVLKKASQMVKEGAKIIDIGAESTRPFSKKISSGQELERLVPALKAIRKEFKKIIISVDTYKPKVAQAAIEEGVDVINDITALASPKITSLVARHKLGCVLMHMQKKPADMQVNPCYNSVSQAISSFFKERINHCLGKGISREQIFIDPGIGFGKTKEHNCEIINNLSQFKIFSLPIFIGISRKSFIGAIIKKGPAARLGGTLAAQLLALERGAKVLRVHDVAQTKEAIKVFSEIKKNGSVN